MCTPMKYNEDLYIVSSVMFDGNGETTHAIASFIVLALPGMFSARYRLTIARESLMPDYR